MRNLAAFLVKQQTAIFVEFMLEMLALSFIKTLNREGTTVFVAKSRMNLLLVIVMIMVVISRIG